MKNSRRCSKCGGSDIVRIPDRRGRCASGNNIYTSNFENFGKIPVIRYVCAAAAMWKTGWKILPPAGHPHALRLTCKWKTAPAARPLNGLQGAVLFFFYGSAAALCAGRAALSAGLPVICARAVLSQEVLVLHILGRRSRARVDLNRQKRHFRHFLQHRGMIYSLSRVFAPCEGPWLRQMTPGTWTGSMSLARNVSTMTVPVFFS